MSVNIPESIVRIADPIFVTIRYDKLGPVQQKALIRGVQTRTFVQRGVSTYLAKSLLRHHFGDNHPYMLMDNWRMFLQGLTHDEYQRVADMLDEVLVVGGLDDTSIKWSEAQRGRYSWRSNGTTVVPEPSGFENLTSLITKLRNGNFTGTSASRYGYIHLNEIMSDTMHKHTKKLMLDTRKNKSVLPPCPKHEELAERIRSGEIRAFTCRAQDL